MIRQQNSLPATLLAATYGSTAVLKNLDCSESTKLEFDITYRLGTGETNNTLLFTIWASPDQVTWYQLQNSSKATGTTTYVPEEGQYVGATDGVDYTFPVVVDPSNKYYMITFAESGKASNFGTVAVQANTFVHSPGVI